VKKLSLYSDKELNERVLNFKISKRFLGTVLKEMFRREFWKDWEKEILFGVKKRTKNELLGTQRNS
jgi:hypothetical protein